MKIIVIGGSIGGLSAGIALRCKGYDVEIYERSSGTMKDRGAGLVVQQDMMDYMNEHNISTTDIFGIPINQVQEIGGNEKVLFTMQSESSFSSWNYIWEQLKEYFPKNKYFYGHELSFIQEKEDKVEVTFTNGVKKIVDLLIGADGYNSKVRSYILPEVDPIYSGYIAYRGLINESDLTPNEISFFQDKYSIFRYEHSHILSYFVPGLNGNLTKGNRLLNWVWYVNKTQDELDEILIDTKGRKHNFSIPPSLLSEKSKRELYNKAYKDLPKIFSHRVIQTVNPFVQAIIDLESPKMYKGRIIIIGDAASVVRPHTASGTAKASRDSIALANSLSSIQKGDSLESVLHDWSAKQVRNVKGLASYGKSLAMQSGFGYL